MSQQTPVQSKDHKAPVMNRAQQPRMQDPDDFRMFYYKVLPCPKTYRHNWQTCPFAHFMERERRRDPRTCFYVDEFCEFAKKKRYCPMGDNCTMAHNLLELWLHPNRYRTMACKDSEACRRPLCFFAHNVNELRERPAGLPPLTPINQEADPSLDIPSDPCSMLQQMENLDISTLASSLTFTDGSRPMAAAPGPATQLPMPTGSPPTGSDPASMEWCIALLNKVKAAKGSAGRHTPTQLPQAAQHTQQQVPAPQPQPWQQAAPVPDQQGPVIALVLDLVSQLLKQQMEQNPGQAAQLLSNSQLMSLVDAVKPSSPPPALAAPAMQWRPAVAAPTPLPYATQPMQSLHLVPYAAPSSSLPIPPIPNFGTVSQSWGAHAGLVSSMDMLTPAVQLPSDFSSSLPLAQPAYTASLPMVMPAYTAGMDMLQRRSSPPAAMPAFATTLDMLQSGGTPTTPLAMPDRLGGNALDSTGPQGMGGSAMPELLQAKPAAVSVAPSVPAQLQQPNGAAPASAPAGHDDATKLSAPASGIVDDGEFAFSFAESGKAPPALAAAGNSMEQLMAAFAAAKMQSANAAAPVQQAVPQHLDGTAIISLFPAAGYTPDPAAFARLAARLGGMQGGDAGEGAGHSCGSSLLGGKLSPVEGAGAAGAAGIRTHA